MNKSKMFNLKKATLAFCILLLNIVPAQAQDNQEPVAVGKPYTTLIESSGLYQQDNPNSLGNGLYHGADRKSIAILLEKVVINTPWITQNTLLRKLLLTQADTGILENAGNLSPENDLLAGRLKALLMLGMQNQAFQLYTNLENSKGHSNLHYYGVLSMLMSSEKALACVEIKTLYPRYKDQSEWQSLNTYCTKSLSNSAQSPVENNSSNYSGLNIPYSQETFSKLSLMEKTYLMAERRHDLSSLSIDGLKDIPASHVQALLSNKTISASQRLILTFRGVDAGVIEPGSIETLYSDISEDIEDQKRKAGDLEKIAILYTEMKKSWLNASKVKSLNEILDYARKHGHAALVPFMNILTDIDPEKLEIDFKDFEILLHAAIIGGIELPFDWSYSLAQMTVENKEEKKLRDRLIASSFLLSDPSKARKKKRSIIVDIITQSQSTVLNNTKNIIENIDIQLGNHANVTLFYENKLELYGNKSYKMPSYALLNAIKGASESSLASVILLSNIALKKQEQGMIYAGTLAFICEALNKTGLTKEARYILSEYIMRAKER